MEAVTVEFGKFLNRKSKRFKAPQLFFFCKLDFKLENYVYTMVVAIPVIFKSRLLSLTCPGRVDSRGVKRVEGDVSSGV